MTSISVRIICLLVVSGWVVDGIKLNLLRQILIRGVSNPPLAMVINLPLCGGMVRDWRDISTRTGSILILNMKSPDELIAHFGLQPLQRVALTRNQMEYIQSDAQKAEMYFITAISVELFKNHKSPSSRCFGYHPTLEKAQQAVVENQGEMYECLYDYIVIEKYSPGCHTLADDKTYWYKWEHPDWKPLKDDETPSWAKGIINWAIG
jgi:phage protein U